MLSALGDPHRVADAVHVGGTNGKGSTAALVETALRRAGRRTGLYTSPHLHRFEERIRIQGETIDPGLLEACAEAVLPLAEAEDASFFEATTVLAFEAFRRAGCDAVSIEVGLGGRLDATNVLEPRATVISSVDRDHSEYLGDSLAEIAGEKAGILKPGVPCVLGPLDPVALEVVESRARHLDAPVHRYGEAFEAGDVSVRLDGTSFSYRSDGWADGLRVRIPLVGDHQARNASLAIRSLESFDSGVGRDSVASGFGELSWPGRFEYVGTKAGSWILDIAHNPQAARQLAALLETLPVPRPRALLLAVLGDKSWDEMLGPLLEQVTACVFTVAPSSPRERRWDPRDALRAARDRRVEVESDFHRAVDRARELARDGTVIVTGSAHTVGDARARILPIE
jgi:dihydrofolate synthase/folylpolyglutamate synthase